MTGKSGGDEPEGEAESEREKHRVKESGLAAADSMPGPDMPGNGKPAGKAGRAPPSMGNWKLTDGDGRRTGKSGSTGQAGTRPVGRVPGGCLNGGSPGGRDSGLRNHPAPKKGEAPRYPNEEVPGGPRQRS